MLKRYADKPIEERAARTGELVAAGDDNEAAVRRRSLPLSPRSRTKLRLAGCTNQFGNRSAWP
jgi:hypothetical protein